MYKGYIEMRLNELFEEACYPEDEPVSFSDLLALEKYLDAFFNRFKLDIHLTGKHFVDRINDERNGEQITICELRETFKAFYRQYYKYFSKFRDSMEAVIKDLNSSINIPFIVKYDRRNDELDIVGKTIMRKKNFYTDTPILRVNSGLASK